MEEMYLSKFFSTCVSVVSESHLLYVPAFLLLSPKLEASELTSTHTKGVRKYLITRVVSYSLKFNLSNLSCFFFIIVCLFLLKDIAFLNFSLCLLATLLAGLFVSHSIHLKTVSIQLPHLLSTSQSFWYLSPSPLYLFL